MFKKNNDENIFKSLSTKLDKECQYINLQCNQNCFCKKDITTNNIKRIALDPLISYHESNVYLNLLSNNSNITTLMSISHDEITYETKRLISLRTFLKNNVDYTTYIINELFAFINTFKKYNFIHGNLHIDNIYIKINKDNKHSFNFFIIDLCNSYFINNDFCHYKRTSFLNEYDSKKNLLFYWDFCSIWSSLSLFYENKNKIIQYIKSTIVNYIGKDAFENFLSQYNDFLKSEHYNNIKIKYNSI